MLSKTLLNVGSNRCPLVIFARNFLAWQFSSSQMKGVLKYYNKIFLSKVPRSFAITKVQKVVKRSLCRERLLWILQE